MLSTTATNKGILLNFQVDSTPHENDVLEVKLLKDEVNVLRFQLKEANSQLT